MQQTEIIRFNHGSNVKMLNRSYIVVNNNGTCILSKRAAEALNLVDLDTVAIYHNQTKTKFFLVNDAECGAQIRKNSGTFRFCDTKALNLIFVGYSLTAKKATLLLGTEIQTINEKKALEIINRPFNIK